MASLDVASGNYYLYNVAVNLSAQVNIDVCKMYQSQVYVAYLFIRQSDYISFNIGLTAGNQSLTYRPQGETSGYGKFVSGKLSAL